jgi:hypothetical protein
LKIKFLEFNRLSFLSLICFHIKFRHLPSLKDI